MSKFKKTLAMFLSALLVIGTVSISAFAALPSDATGSTHKEAIETLGALGIMIGDDHGMFNPEKSITRSEVAKVAVYALGLADAAESAKGTTRFPDVTADHLWASGYINIAVSQKLVIGDESGNFNPDRPITYAEAMTIIVRMLGREPIAVTKGQYPTGYLIEGADCNITRNASGKAADPAARELVAQMVFNALTTKMVERTNFGDKVEYGVVDKTLLKDKLNTTKVQGQVTATSQTKLNGTGTLKKNEVQIDDVTYRLADGVDAANVLGYNVAAYNQEDVYGEEHIILVRAEETKNNSLTISADNFENITNETGKKVVSYWKDKDNDTRATLVDVNLDARLIYNGKSETMDNTLANLKGKAGNVDLLDSDRDGKYDLIFVTEYKNIVVEETVVSSGKIVSKYGAATITLDPEDKDLDYTIMRGATKIDVKDLKEWDVVSVAASKDNTIYRMVVVGEPVTGKVTEIDQEGRVTIGDDKYKIAANYTAGIRLEDEGTFYLDVEGKIAAVDTTGRISSNYAYLLNAAMISYLDDTLELKVFTKAGETQIVKVADKVRLNGVNNKTPQEVLNALSSNGTVNRQLVTFDKNSEGKINTIDTAVASQQVSKDVFTKNYTLNNAVYKDATGKVGNINVDASTIIFDIPSGSQDPEDYTVTNRSMFENDTPYNVVVFDMTEDFTARAMIVTSTDYRANAEAAVAIVTSVTSVKNSQNAVVDKLYAMQDGKQVELLSSEAGVLVKAGGAKVEKGDIVQYKTNSKNEISTVRVLFDIASKTTQFTATPATDLTTMYGEVVQKFAGSMNMTVAGGEIQNVAFAGAKVYRVDASKTNNAVTVATAGDIQKYDDSDANYVFVKSYKDVVTEIVIIKL